MGEGGFRQNPSRVKTGLYFDGGKTRGSDEAKLQTQGIPIKGPHQQQFLAELKEHQ